MVAFVQELNKNSIFKIKSEKKEEKLFYFLSINKDCKTSKIIKIANRLSKLLEKKQIKHIVLSENLFKNKILKENIKGVKILNGNKLFLYLLIDIVNYAFSKSNMSIYTSEISVLLNKSSAIVDNIINQLAEKCKRLNIITNNFENFKQIENNLYNELGISIKISNNKKQDLLSSNIILNIDFSESLLNKYTFSHRCILINITEKCKIQSKRFEGITVNNYEIDMPKEYYITGFNKSLIYESIINNRLPKEIENIIKRDKIKISKLIGENGIIAENEFLKNSLDKN